MAQNQSTVAVPSSNPSVTVHEGDTLTLSPDSKTYGHAFRAVTPTTIDEARDLLGPRLSAEDRKRACPCVLSPELAAGFASVAELEAHDSAIRNRAIRLAKLAAIQYVRAINSGLDHWRPVLDHFVKFIAPRHIVIGTFSNIEVANGATLLLVTNVDAIYANQIKLFGNGRIVCEGPKAIRARSFEGFIGVVPGGSL